MKCSTMVHIIFICCRSFKPNQPNAFKHSLAFWCCQLSFWQWSHQATLLLAFKLLYPSVLVFWKKKIPWAIYLFFLIQL